MKIKLLDLKREMEFNGMKVLDLSSLSFALNYFDPSIFIDKIIRAETKHIARADLVSWDAYRSVDHVDVILKFNQISNPFSINEGDFLIIPNLVSISGFYQKTKANSDTTTLDTKFIYIDPEKASKKDKNRLKQLENISRKRKSGSKEIKPTNLLREKEVPFRIENGALKLGGSK